MLNRVCVAPVKVPDGIVATASPFPPDTQDIRLKAMVSPVALTSAAGAVADKVALDAVLLPDLKNPPKYTWAGTAQKIKLSYELAVTVLSVVSATEPLPMLPAGTVVLTLFIAVFFPGVPPPATVPPPILPAPTCKYSDAGLLEMVAINACAELVRESIAQAIAGKSDFLRLRGKMNSGFNTVMRLTLRRREYCQPNQPCKWGHPSAGWSTYQFIKVA